MGSSHSDPIKQIFLDFWLFRLLKHFKDTLQTTDIRKEPEIKLKSISVMFEVSTRRLFVRFVELFEESGMFLHINLPSPIPNNRTNTFLLSCTWAALLSSICIFFSPMQVSIFFGMVLSWILLDPGSLQKNWIQIGSLSFFQHPSSIRSALLQQSVLSVDHYSSLLQLFFLANLWYISFLKYHLIFFAAEQDCKTLSEKRNNLMTPAMRRSLLFSKLCISGLALAQRIEYNSRIKKSCFQRW